MKIFWTFWPWKILIFLNINQHDSSKVKTDICSTLSEQMLSYGRVYYKYVMYHKPNLVILLKIDLETFGYKNHGFFNSQWCI